MKKKIILIGMSALLLCGCGKIPTLSNGDEAVVEFKDGKKISVNELYDEIKDTYGLNTLVSMIDTYIYETEFKSTISEAKDYAAAIVKQLRDSYEKESDLLSFLSSYSYRSVEQYENVLYQNYLQNEAIEKYVNDQITEDELKEYYEKSVYPNMTISHILITSSATSSDTEETKTKAEEEALKEAKDIIKKLNQAKKDGKNIPEEFASLAKEYSKDSGTKDKGGDLGEINIGSLDSAYDELVKAAGSLKDGEFSTEAIKTEAGYHVILKTKTGKKASYEDSKESMINSITTDKLTNNYSLSVDAIKYYRDKYELNIIDDELKSQYGTYMNNLINNSRNN